MYKSLIALLNFSFILALSFVLFSCEFASDVEDKNSDGFRYPTEIGNRWVYNHVWDNYDFRPDSLSESRPDMTFVYTTEVIGDTLLMDDIKCAVFRESEEGSNFWWRTYYKTNKTGFYQIAYRPGGAGSMHLPRQAGNYQLVLGKMKFYSHRDLLDYVQSRICRINATADTLSYFINPRPVLKYPVIENETWLFHNEGPMRIWKIVTGRENVETDTGTFNCYKIQWIYEANDTFPADNIELFDYISEKGLVKRTIDIKDIAVTSIANPEEPIGYYNSRDEITLIDINF